MSRLPQDNVNDALPRDEVLMSESERSTATVVEAEGGLCVRYAGQTAVGLVREHNEDNLVIANLASESTAPNGEVCSEEIGESGMMFAVCDGMGGAAAGEVASQMAVDILVEALRRGGPPGARDDLARRLVSAVEESGKRIFDTAQAERSKRGMGTTATVAALLDKVLFLAEVGDSRAYLLRDGELAQLTKDQSLVNQLIEAGHLTEEEAEAFEHSNIILQALGTSDSVQVDLTFVELRKGDRLMLCSDGLSGLVHDDSIRDALQEFTEPLECCSRLIEYAEAGGGHDNITVIIADFDGHDLVEPQASDSFGYLQYPLIPGPSGAANPSPEVGLDPHVAPTVPAPAGDAGTWNWIIAGLVALAVGGAVLLLSPSSEPAVAESGPSVAAPANQEPPVAREEVPAPVPVRVYTDVESATLMVNGEPRGMLTAGSEQTLSLTPGAYRFEAESGGDILAVSVVTIRPEVPLDIHLDLPTGTEVAGAERAGENTQAEQAEAAKRTDSRKKSSAVDVRARAKEVERSPSIRVKRRPRKQMRAFDTEAAGAQPGTPAPKVPSSVNEAQPPKEPVAASEQPAAARPTVQSPSGPGLEAQAQKTRATGESRTAPASGSAKSRGDMTQRPTPDIGGKSLPANPF